MTLTQKILARASDRPYVAPGENVWVTTDVLMTHDVCGPGTIGIFKKEFGEKAKVSRHPPLGGATAGSRRVSGMSSIAGLEICA